MHACATCAERLGTAARRCPLGRRCSISGLPCCNYVEDMPVQHLWCIHAASADAAKQPLQIHSQCPPSSWNLLLFPHMTKSQPFKQQSLQLQHRQKPHKTAVWPTTSSHQSRCMHHLACFHLTHLHHKSVMSLVHPCVVQSLHTMVRCLEV